MGKRSLVPESFAANVPEHILDICMCRTKYRINTHMPGVHPQTFSKRKRPDDDDDAEHAPVYLNMLEELGDGAQGSVDCYRGLSGETELMRP